MVCKNPAAAAVSACDTIAYGMSLTRCIALSLAVAACAAPRLPTPAAPRDSASVWSADFMRTKPGQQERYVRYVSANWARARRTALEQGKILSFRVLVAVPDSAGGWDVALLTEYPDSAAYANREAVFRPILDAQGETLVDGLSGRGADNVMKTSIRSTTMRSPAGMP